MPRVLRRTATTGTAEGPSEPIGYGFFCPGCRCYHMINVERPNSVTGARWSFDGNLEAPTFSPSILVNPGLPSGAKGRCHSFIRAGRIEFLGDCGHPLAGQTVPMVDVDNETW